MYSIFLTCDHLCWPTPYEDASWSQPSLLWLVRYSVHGFHPLDSRTGHI